MAQRKKFDQRAAEQRQARERERRGFKAFTRPERREEVFGNPSISNSRLRRGVETMKIRRTSGRRGG